MSIRNSTGIPGAPSACGGTGAGSWARRFMTCTSARPSAARCRGTRTSSRRSWAMRAKPFGTKTAWAWRSATETPERSKRSWPWASSPRNRPRRSCAWIWPGCGPRPCRRAIPSRSRTPSKTRRRCSGCSGRASTTEPTGRSSGGRSRSSPVCAGTWIPIWALPPRTLRESWPPSAACGTCPAPTTPTWSRSAPCPPTGAGAWPRRCWARPCAGQRPWAQSRPM